MQRWRPPFGVGQERLALLAPLLPDSALTLVGLQTEAESRVTPPRSRWCCVRIGSGKAALLLFVTLFPLFGTSVPLALCRRVLAVWMPGCLWQTRWWFWYLDVATETGLAGCSVPRLLLAGDQQDPPSFPRSPVWP